MTGTYVILVAPKTNKLFFVEAFIVKSFATPDAVVTSHFGGLRIVSVAGGAVVRGTPELLGGC